jgi:23S rRNA (adenine2503-C2)-methyltransferase
MNETEAPSADILDLSLPKLQAQLALWREPSYRADQIWGWLYKRFAAGFDEMSNLPLMLRQRLSQFYRISPLKPIDEQLSRDRLTRKVLFGLPDEETIESVLMMYDRRYTVCVSSQVGCPVGCTFCATGRSGFARNLSVAEIVAQPLYFARQLSTRDLSVTNVVLMGMGEPMLNYEAVWEAIERWNNHQGFDLGARKITLSTVGYVPGIRRMAQEDLQVGLAVSLHAAEDTLRDQLVPLNRTYPLSELIEACRDYVEQTGRRLTIEYALIDEVNDSTSQAQALADLLSGLMCHVNLIPLNPSLDGGYRPSPLNKVLEFEDVLEARRIPTTVRLRRGADIQAGCGQLRQRTLEQ